MSLPTGTGNCHDLCAGDPASAHSTELYQQTAKEQLFVILPSYVRPGCMYFPLNYQAMAIGQRKKQDSPKHFSLLILQWKKRK